MIRADSEEGATRVDNDERQVEWMRQRPERDSNSTERC